MAMRRRLRETGVLIDSYDAHKPKAGGRADLAPEPV